jgi:hypothetical protein
MSSSGSLRPAGLRGRSPRWLIVTAVTSSSAVQTQIGAVHGASRSRPFDRWFRYPAGLSEQALKVAVDAVGSKPRRIIDPFVGSAVSAGGIGRRSLTGIEAHPLIADLAATKLAQPPDPITELQERADALVDDARGRRPTEVDQEASLVQRCFTPEVLRSLVGLREAIAEESTEWDRYLRWALLGTLRDVASVKVGWPYQRPGVERRATFSDPVGRFLERVRMMSEDLVQTSIRPRGRIIQGDSRSASSWKSATEDGLFDATLTSPPYLNNFDYADATRLELYFLGAVSSWADMCSKVRSEMVIATTQQSSLGSARDALGNLGDYPSILPEVKDIEARLKEERDRRARGKEYNQVLPAYFDDLGRVLSHLHASTEPGAISAWIVGDSAPYGVYIDTPRLIALLAKDLGFLPGSDVTVRSRGLRWRTNGTRHQVPLSERLITFTRA